MRRTLQLLYVAAFLALGAAAGHFIGTAFPDHDFAAALALVVSVCIGSIGYSGFIFIWTE